MYESIYLSLQKSPVYLYYLGTIEYIEKNACQAHIRTLIISKPSQTLYTNVLSKPIFIVEVERGSDMLPCEGSRTFALWKYDQVYVPCGVQKGSLVRINDVSGHYHGPIFYEVCHLPLLMQRRICRDYRGYSHANLFLKAFAW